MISKLIDLFAPHYCCSCDKVGSILCECCKNNILKHPLERCVYCGVRKSKRGKICRKCKAPFSQAWCVGWRQGVLQTLIGAYKFERAAGASKVLAELLDQTIDELPSDTIVTSIPTIPAHIRRRGYDHAALLAKEFAALRKLQYKPVLIRKEFSVQHGTKSAARRQMQAEESFACDQELSGNFLIIDDIYTTGATLKSAAWTLIKAGADDVKVAAIARQPIEN